MIISLLCYLTIWNSPADITGTGVVHDGAKKADKGNSAITILLCHLLTPVHKPNICISIRLTSVSPYNHCIYSRFGAYCSFCIRPVTKGGGVGPVGRPPNSATSTI